MDALTGSLTMVEPRKVVWAAKLATGTLDSKVLTSGVTVTVYLQLIPC